MNKILLSILLVFVSCGNLRKTADWNFDTFHKELVNRHNELRKKHSAGALTVLKDLTTLCQKTVDNCKKLGTLQHGNLNMDDGTRVGQNLFLSSWAPTGTEVADDWYSENVDYDYSTGKAKNNNAVVGHFTQLVWKGSKQIGCAVAVGPWLSYKNSYYVGCDYLPPGNYIGQEVENVSPPTS